MMRFHRAIRGNPFFKRKASQRTLWRAAGENVSTPPRLPGSFPRFCTTSRCGKTEKTFGRFIDLSAIEVVSTKITFIHPDPTRDFKYEFQYVVQLRVANKANVLGTYGSESAANRFGRAIAAFLNKPLLRQTGPPVASV